MHKWEEYFSPGREDNDPTISTGLVITLSVGHSSVNFNEGKSEVERERERDGEMDVKNSQWETE